MALADDQTALLAEAFKVAWHYLQQTPGECDAILREAVARRIILKAQLGDTDIPRLAREAIRFGSNYKRCHITNAYAGNRLKR